MQRGRTRPSWEWSAKGGGMSTGSELLGFGRFGEGESRGEAAGDDLCDGVGVAGADFTLVFCGAVAVGLGGELAGLELAVGGHVAVVVAAREVEHAHVEGVEAGEGDELELVAHGAELALELGDGGVVEVLFPVEGGRAVVG